MEQLPSTVWQPMPAARAVAYSDWQLTHQEFNCSLCLAVHSVMEESFCPEWQPLWSRIADFQLPGHSACHEEIALYFLAARAVMD